MFPRKELQHAAYKGRTVAALRTLASTAGEQEGKTVTLEIRDTPYKG